MNKKQNQRKRNSRLLHFSLLQCFCFIFSLSPYHRRCYSIPTLAFFISPFCFTHNLSVSSPLHRAALASSSKSCEQNNPIWSFSTPFVRFFYKICLELYWFKKFLWRINRTTNYSKRALRIFNNYDQVTNFKDLFWNFMGIKKISRRKTTALIEFFLKFVKKNSGRKT
jgi:hypothetical protein